MKNLFSTKHIATTIILALNVVLFLGMVITTGTGSLVTPPVPALIDWGANFGPLTLTSEPWRLITCAFVHGNLLHLVVNMYALGAVGPEIEKNMGTARFLYCYLISALTGAIVSMEFQPTYVSVGASGAIFGIVGAAFAYVAPGTLEQVRATLKRRVIVLSAFVCLNLAFGIFVRGIDNAAHMGGLIGGLAAGFAVSLPSSKRFREHAIAIMGLLAALPLACYLMMFKQFEHDPRLPGWMPLIYGQARVNEKKYEQSLPYFDKALKHLPADTDKKYYKERLAMLVSRAAALVELKRFTEALRDLEDGEKIAEEKLPLQESRARVLHHLGRFEEAAKLYLHVAKNNKHKEAEGMLYNNLAWSQLACGKLDEALKNVNTALDANKSETTTIDTRATAYLLMQKYDDALADLNRAIEIKPKEGALYFHRAGVYLAKGQTKEADEDLKLAKELKYTPDNWEPKAFPELCSRLEQVRN